MVVLQSSSSELTEYARGGVWDVLLPPGAKPASHWRVVTSISEPVGTRLPIVGSRPRPEATEAVPGLEEG
jgi:hypothetical protein